MTNQGTAMVQMTNADPLKNILNDINYTIIFGKKIQISITNQKELNPVPNPIWLSDGTISYKEYHSNRNNRYQTIEAAQKNNIL